MLIAKTKGAKALLLFVLLTTVAACGLPRGGPNKSEIFKGSVLKEGDAFIVTVNSRVNQLISVQPSLEFSPSFQNAGLLGADTISPGDILSLIVYENVKDDPLLGAPGQRQSTLSELQVDGKGFIFIPYAGKIKAAGQTPDSLRAILTKKLDSQTPDPQIIVSRAPGEGATITIEGAAGQGVYPIEPSTRTLASMLARSGGVSIEPSTAIVRVTRGKQSEKVWLLDLYGNPALDIPLRPGDRITVETDNRYFMALGATGGQSRVQFETETLSALEAIATVGGLNPSTADPTGVFVLRNEPEVLANAVLGRSDLQGAQRMVYVLDLTQPTGMFEARDFLIRDGDTVYVTEAPYVQWQKTLSALTGTAGQARGLAATP